MLFTTAGNLAVLLSVDFVATFLYNHVIPGLFFEFTVCSALIVLQHEIVVCCKNCWMVPWHLGLEELCVFLFRKGSNFVCWAVQSSVSRAYKPRAVSSALLP